MTLPFNQPGSDMEINLKPDSVPPYGESYPLFPDETLELYSYEELQLAKGYIFWSTSPAAAPIFFVKVLGKNDRSVVDYCALDSLTICERFPIPFLGQLLNQLFGCKNYAKIDLKTTFNLF